MNHRLPPSALPEQAADVPTVRVTVPVRQDVLATFQRLAKAGSMSTGRAMGEWLADTSEAAAFMAEKMEQARAAPRIVAQEMHAYALGLADETGALLRRVREKGKPERAPGQPAGGRATAPADPLPPRPVIRGGKSPTTGEKARKTKGPK